MSTTPCPRCKQPIDEYASRCQHCHGSFLSYAAKRRLFIIAAIVVLVNFIVQMVEGIQKITNP